MSTGNWTKIAQAHVALPFTSFIVSIDSNDAELK